MGGVIHRLRRIYLFLLRKHQYLVYHFSDDVIKPIYITPKYVELGENVLIWYHARLEGVSKYNNVCFSPRIILHNGVTIQQNLHLTCAQCIEIGDNTAIAANVTITDIHHPYDDIDTPIERQNLIVKPVKIGNDCKIYNNAVILPGTIIGKHVTVGANSVVSGNFPDYCVIVGAPAKIVKRYDFYTCRWRKTSSKGDFEEQG